MYFRLEKTVELHNNSRIITVVACDQIYGHEHAKQRAYAFFLVSFTVRKEHALLLNCEEDVDRCQTRAVGRELVKTGKATEQKKRELAKSIKQEPSTFT